MVFEVAKKFQWQLYLLVLIPLIFISGCNVVSQHGNVQSSQSPKLVFSGLGSDVPGMTASLEIKGVGTYSLTDSAAKALRNVSSASSRSFSTTVKDLAAGTYTMIVTYSANGVTLAVATRSVDVSIASTISVTFKSQDINKNFDDDSDGWVNLAEILWGSEPLLSSSAPPGDSPQFVFNTSGGVAESTTYSVQSSLGEAISTQQGSSWNYAMSGGFQAYH
jgi:hypothetical protein